MRVLHLADIHVDREYAVGSEAECSNEEGFIYAFCCRDYPPGKSASKDTINTPAPKWGIAANCDIPYITFEESMKFISEHETLDYIIITGDLEPHAIWDYTQESTTANIVNITNTLLKYFPNIPVFQAIGNHEGVPMDAYVAHFIIFHYFTLYVLGLHLTAFLNTVPADLNGFTVFLSNNGEIGFHNLLRNHFNS